MTLIEQLLTGLLVGAITVSTVGGYMELKERIEAHAQKEASIIQQYEGVIDGGDVDSILSMIEGG